MARRSLLTASRAALRCISDLGASPSVSASFRWRALSNRWLNYKDFLLVRQFTTSIPKIRLKKDRPLDVVADKEKELRPLLLIRDTILKFKKDAMPFRFVAIRRRMMGLKMSTAKFEIYMRQYPNFFEFFTHPEEKLPWCKLTAQLMELVEEERQIYARQEPLVVEKLKRLLMISQDHQIRANKLVLASGFFGFPSDFLTSVVPKYPQYFRLAQDGKPFQTLGLVAWDESLAITEFEKKAKAEAKESGLGDIETRGLPLAFKFQYSPGMGLTRKVMDFLDGWQKLPYVCPYEQVSGAGSGSPMADKRMVALLHEILSLTVEKKIYTEVLEHFRREFSLPQNLARMCNRFPGVFYISLKGAVHTVYLREAYQKWQLVEEHPLLSLKEKYYKMVKKGPQIRIVMSKARRSGRIANTELDLHSLEEAAFSDSGDEEEERHA